MSQWITLDADERRDLENGEFVPLDARETDDGQIEVWMPHQFPTTFEVHRICQECNLLPLDYDAVEVPCT